MAEVKAWCPSCGGNVTCEVRRENNKKTTICGNCRFVVDEREVAAPPSVAPMAFNVPDAGAPAAALPQAQQPAPAMRALGTVLSAEDIPAIRNALQSMLVSKGVARQVVSTENGFDALVAFHQALRNKVKLDLLIFDVNMPILDGINLAVCVRAAEKAAGTPPHPILFFTSNICDDPFRRALEYLSPARYINKGQGNSGEEFADRLVMVVQSLLGGA